MAANLTMYTTKYIDGVHTDENALYNGKLLSTAQISKALTYLYGRRKMSSFPLQFLTQGQKGGYISKAPVKLDSTEYTWPIMGLMKHTNQCLGLSNTSNTAPGLGGTIFKALFQDGSFHKYYHIYSPDYLSECRVEDEPDLLSNGQYEYTLQLISGTSTDYVAVANFTTAKFWVSGATSIPLSHSDGTASNDLTPGSMKNQWGAHRWSKNIAGNVVSKVLEVEFTLEGGGKTKNWMPFSLDTWQVDMRESKEFDLWNSKYNRDAYGKITTIDTETGKAVPRGAGVKEQIQAVGNYSTYSTLSLAKLNSTVHSVYGNRVDREPMEIVCYTGTPGAMNFHNAIMTDAAASSYYQALGDATVQRNGGIYLSYGAYFNQYKMITGDTLTVVVTDFFNKGRWAEMDRANGNLDSNGLPMSASDLVFLDHSIDSESGERNIQLVAEQGREHIAKIYPGMAVLPPEWKAAGMEVASTKKDIATFEIIDTDGICFKNPTTSFWLAKA